MTCPDWNDLVRQRASGQQEPADWRRALNHLDSCDACRGQALASDPLLVFRPRLGTGSGREVEPGEVADMRRSVHAVVRSRSWEAPRRAVLRSSAWRLVAVFALLAFLLFLGPEGADGPSPARLAGTASVSQPDRPIGSPSPKGLIDDLAEAMPVSLVEEVDRPGARIYELRRENLSLVMIVDDTLDV